MRDEITLMAGGEAGQGVQSVGATLAGTFNDGGLCVFADQDYESRVRGGHNFFRIRAAKQQVRAINEKLDILVALNRETIDLHRRELAAGGIIIYDAETLKEHATGKQYFDVPFARLAKETAGNLLMVNAVAAGAVLGLGGMKFDILAATLKKEFARHGDKIVADNINAARAGYDYAVKNGARLPMPSLRDTGDRKRLLVNGNDAFALGAMAAGCRFIASYPMTPASSIMEYMAEKGRDYSVVTVHVEDEIAAINMAAGAGFAGARAMVATSGGGFALMVEGLALAGMTETPVVVVLGQRPGPATGLPTRTEQGELWFALHAGHGEFPRAVLSPTDAVEAFESAVNAFNLAEKYQAPVIVLTDHHLASSFMSVEPFKLDKVVIDRGDLLTDKDMENPADYLRHLVTRSGVSPRALPGLGKALVITDSDEHNEAGHMIEDAATRNRQVEKRLRKMKGLLRDVVKPSARHREGAIATLVGWGSTAAAIRETAALLEKDGLLVNTLNLPQVWPFPSASVKKELALSPKAIIVEGNATGQLAGLLRRETGIEAAATVLRYDGRPHTPASIARRVRKEVSTW
ncbi:MAG: 2-oxoacid:acceptor oxidoreductase subunit alpha [Deltaproteobacteria bacterium]|nr:2-oxoacid:acceptor oxidoreductase subunit alpha [Candidatus Anaeroferrophillacea bacterium]